MNAAVTWHAAPPPQPDTPSVIEQALAARLREHDTNNQFAAMVADLRRET